MMYSKSWRTIRNEKCPACGRPYGEHKEFSEWLRCQDKLWRGFQETNDGFKEAVSAAMRSTKRLDALK